MTDIVLTTDLAYNDRRAHVDHGVGYAMPFLATIESETIRVVSGGDGLVWDIERAAELTGASVHSVGSTVTPVASSAASDASLAARLLVTLNVPQAANPSGEESPVAFDTVTLQVGTDVVLDDDPTIVRVRTDGLYAVSAWATVWADPAQLAGQMAYVRLVTPLGLPLQEGTPNTEFGEFSGAISWTGFLAAGAALLIEAEVDTLDASAFTVGAQMLVQRIG